MSRSCPAGKGSWPEVVGMNGEAAANIIMAENPKVKARTVDEDSVVTGDFKCDRVRVFVNDQGIVPRFSGESSWPELVGINGEAAANIIIEGNPRVLVFVNDKDIVTEVPTMVSYIYNFECEF